MVAQYQWMYARTYVVSDTGVKKQAQLGGALGLDIRHTPGKDNTHSYNVIWSGHDMN